MKYQTLFNTEEVYQALFARQFSRKHYKTPEYKDHRKKLIRWVFDLAHKLKLSDNSAHLAVYLLDLTITKMKVNVN